MTWHTLVNLAWASVLWTGAAVVALVLLRNSAAVLRRNICRVTLAGLPAVCAVVLLGGPGFSGPTLLTAPAERPSIAPAEPIAAAVEPEPTLAALNTPQVGSAATPEPATVALPPMIEPTSAERPAATFAQPAPAERLEIESPVVAPSYAPLASAGPVQAPAASPRSAPVASIATAGSAAEPQPSAEPVGVDPLTLLAAVGVLGAAVLLGLQARRAVQLHRWRRRWMPASLGWTKVTHSLARRCGLSPLPAVCVAEGLNQPAAAGVVQPVIVLPHRAPRTLAPALQTALPHELGHLAGRDPLWNLLAEATLALAWWCPMTWLLVRRHRVESELAADDYALQSGIEPVDLAETLAAFAELNLGSAPAGVSGMACHLNRRIKMMIDEKQPHIHRLSRLSRWGMLMTAVLASLMIAATPLVGIARADGEGDRETSGERRDGDREGGERERDGDRPRDSAEREGGERSAERDAGPRESREREGGERSAERDAGPRESREREGGERSAERDAGPREGGERDGGVVPGGLEGHRTDSGYDLGPTSAEASVNRGLGPREGIAIQSLASNGWLVLEAHSTDYGYELLWRVRLTRIEGDADLELRYAGEFVVVQYGRQRHVIHTPTGQVRQEPAEGAGMEAPRLEQARDHLARITRALEAAESNLQDLRQTHGEDHPTVAMFQNAKVDLIEQQHQARRLVEELEQQADRPEQPTERATVEQMRTRQVLGEAERRVIELRAEALMAEVDMEALRQARRREGGERPSERDMTRAELRLRARREQLDSAQREFDELREMLGD